MEYSFAQFDHECFMIANEYKIMLRKHTDWILSYFIKFSNANCEVSYSDLFNCCEREFEEFDTSIFEHAYSELVKNKTINIVVNFNRFDGSASVRGQVDPTRMLSHAVNVAGR